ncbi:hypothetical protein D3C80_1998750 [compost metagenome]
MAAVRTGALLDRAEAATLFARGREATEEAAAAARSGRNRTISWPAFKAEPTLMSFQSARLAALTL